MGEYGKGLSAGLGLGLGLGIWVNMAKDSQQFDSH